MKGYCPKECTAAIPSDAPGCYPENYVRPHRINHVLLRKKGEKWQVKINGKGKWIDCEYDLEKQTMSFNH